MEQPLAQDLFQKYVSNQCSPEEVDELFDFLEKQDDSTIKQELVDRFLDVQETVEYSDVAVKEKLQKRLQIILQKIEEPQKKPGRLVSIRLRWVAAAVVLIVAGYVLWVTSRKSEVGSQKSEVATMHDVPAPQETRAVITLADGSKVYLDSVNNGTIAQQDNVNVVKNENGAISYQPLAVSSGQIVYNTLTNPRGSRVIDMRLSDGSHVWLNAGSSVTYPVAFVGNERKVEITGEAYFEVAHDANKPFHVTKGSTDITVLGTHFNVNAYDDEDALRVTLLEGSVKVASDKSQVTIKPGQQAKAVSGELSVVNNVEVDEVMAWKNGVFNFHQQDIASIMKELSRWYDADISYEGTRPDDLFSAIINRNNNVSEVLKMLEQTNSVHFKIEGKKITVSK